MSDQTREIEQSLEQDRMALAESLVALRERLAPATLVAQGKEAIMSRAQPLLSRLDSTVMARPAVAAVAGVAVATLVFGRHRETSVAAQVGSKFEAVSRWEGEGGPVDNPPEVHEEWLTEAHGLRARATKMLHQIEDAAKRGLAPAVSLAKHRAEVTSALASDTKAALGKGLESLTDAARAEAYEARERIYNSSTALASKSRQTVVEYPLVAGAAMVAAGAVVAWMFPPTKTEDRLMGDLRDSLVNDARTAARTEAVKASDLARSLTSALGRDMQRAKLVLRPDGRPMGGIGNSY